MTVHSRDTLGFTGFDEAQHTLACYTAREHVAHNLQQTDFLTDSRIQALHVNNTSRLDRMQLTAFDRDGDVVRAFTMYNDDGKGLESTPNFQLQYDKREGREGSALDTVNEDGWLIDMNAVRDYDILADRRRTQKAMVLALLRDMLVAGDAEAMMFGRDLMGSTETPASLEH